jgi:DNA topoisomerase-2
VKDASKVEQKGRTIEEQYSRKTPLEHILLRPGMYIGPTQQSPPSPQWIPRPVPSSPQPSSKAISTKESVKNTIQMVREKVPHHPALVKLLDEILVNAFDNRLRHGSKKSTTQIDVVIEPGNGKIEPFISVTNNGKGIPVTIHKKEGIYVPEMLFGHLLTGSNFDDSNQKQVTGGRHGYGAKLTNIFSKKFELETLDSVREKKYTQKWENNMRVMHDAEVVSLKEKDLPEGGDYTRITFVPDILKVTNGNLHLDVNNAIPPEDYAIMCRRVYDVAGCGGGELKVTLNGKVLPIFSFRDYIELFRPSSSPNICYQKINSRWEVGIGLSSSGSFENISFVNGMDTSRGGTHVNAIVQQVTKRIVDKVTKDYSELADTVSQAMVRRHLCVFVNCLIENPSFDSQMKESLTSSPSSFGSNYTLSETYFKKLLKDEQSGGPGIIEEVVTAAQGRQQASLLRLVGGKKKTKRQLLNIPKLDDAHLAGSGDGHKCSLILTEGDSAKALAVAGLEVVGRELYGVFPLRGKFLNVRGRSRCSTTRKSYYHF